MNIKRNICIAVALIILTISLTGCGSSPIKEDAYDTTVIMQADGNDVMYSIYRHYYLLNNQSASSALTALREDYAVLQTAVEYGVALDESELSAIADAREETVSSLGSEEAFLGFLRERYLTTGAYDFLARVDKLRTKLFSDLCVEGGALYEEVADGDVFDFAKSSFFHTQHIYIADADYSNAQLANDAAKDIYQSVLNVGIDAFNGTSSSGKYTKTPSLYFTYDQFSDEYSTATFALKPGETSGLVSTDSGYYIIKRLEVDEQYVNDNLNLFKEAYAKDNLYEKLDTCGLDIKFTYEEIYSKLNSDNIK